MDGIGSGNGGGIGVGTEKGRNKVGSQRGIVYREMRNSQINTSTANIERMRMAGHGAVRTWLLGGTKAMVV